MCVACTEIRTFKDLEYVLGEVSGVSAAKKCDYLGLKKVTCNGLDPRDPNFNLAKDYMKQNPEPCWENIIQILCEFFNDARLAKEVHKKYRVPKSIYTKYCVKA